TLCTCCPPPTSPPFPYTTLFRSPLHDVRPARADLAIGGDHDFDARHWFSDGADPERTRRVHGDDRRRLGESVALENHQSRGVERSEEHTSELQSPDHLVCRLLLD